MTDVMVRVTALRWAADDFPGWIEVSIVDADQQEHRVLEKVPVLTTDSITADTPFPVTVWIPAVVDGVGDSRVTLTFSSGVETVDGLSKLAVSSDDVQWP